MDPLAHTLVGATLAETGLKRATPLATATLILGANAPDIDALAMFVSSDTALWFRRGWTHGVLAMLVLPLLLAGLMWALDHYWLSRREAAADRDPARFLPLLGLSYLSVATHPVLDWLNTYGVRLLMPFDGRWFYGDSLFIIDPWMWLLMAAAVVWARSRTKKAMAFWGILGAAASVLVLLIPVVPLGAKITWCAGLVVIIAVRYWSGANPHNERAARATSGLLVAYIAAMLVSTVMLEAKVSEWLGDGTVPKRTMAGPVPANPFASEVVAVADGHYHLLEAHWLGDELITRRADPVPVPSKSEIVDAALRADSVRGLRNWIRFPHYEVERVGEGYEVIIRDLRYMAPDDEPRDFGSATVRLSRDLEPLDDHSP